MTHTLKLVSFLFATLVLTACKDEVAAADNGSSEPQPAAAEEMQSNEEKQASEAQASKLPDRFKSVEDQQPIREQTPMQTTTITGTVTYKDLEGGFFALITENGQRYLPQGLPEKYRQDGIVIKMTGKPRPDVMTIQQFGTPFEVTDVEIVDDAMVKPINNDM